MDRRFDGRGTLPARPIGRLSPSAVFPVGMAEKSFGCPTVRCPASFGHSPGRLRLSGCNRPGVIFQPVPKHPPGFAFMIKRGAPCSALEWVSPVFLVIGTMRRCKEGRRISAVIFRRRFFFPAPGGTFCPKDDGTISFCIIFSDAGRTIPVRIFLTCARRTDLLLSGAAGIGRIPVPAGLTLRPAPSLLLAGVFL